MSSELISGTELSPQIVFCYLYFLTIYDNILSLEMITVWDLPLCKRTSNTSIVCSFVSLLIRCDLLEQCSSIIEVYNVSRERIRLTKLYCNSFSLGTRVSRPLFYINLVSRCEPHNCISNLIKSSSWAYKRKLRLFVDRTLDKTIFEKYDWLNRERERIYDKMVYSSVALNRFSVTWTIVDSRLLPEIGTGLNE